MGIMLAVMLTSPPPGTPAIQPAAVLGLMILVAVACWGMATAVGLFRLRSWARWSVLIFAGLLVLCGAFTALMITMIPIPTTADTARMMPALKAGIAGFYAAMALVGVLWLIYFSRSGVRAQFGSGVVVSEGNGRPVSISIIAWFLIVGGAICLGCTFSSLPVTAFGLLIGGWPARVFCVVFAALNGWIGAGLLRLKPLSRVLAMALFGYGVLNMALFVGLPGAEQRMQTSMGSVPAVLRGSAEYRAGLSIVILGSAMITGAIPLWFLYTRRGVFVQPAGTAER
jgi:hypothetical protein